MKPLLIAAALLLLPAAAQAQVAAASVPNSFDQPRTQQPMPAIPAAAPAPAPMSTTPANPRAQEATVVPILQGFGAIQALDFVGSREGADLFAVTFATAATQWIIGFDES